MRTRTLVVAALALVAARDGFAQGTPVAAPLHERGVKPGAAGANRLAVDSALLVRGAPFSSNGTISTGGLGDLRLREGAGGREVPYIFVSPTSESPTWRGGRIIAVSPGKDTSGFEIDLGGVASVDRVEVPTLPEQFLKRVRLEGSGDRVRWTMLVAEGTLFNLPNEADAPPLRQTQLGFAPGSYRYLRLIWDDHAGPRLATPSSARARLAPRNAFIADTMFMLLSIERRPSSVRTSRYHLRLPATRLPIIGLELALGGTQVLRSAHVTEPQLGAERVAPVQLGAAILRRTVLGEAVASNLRIPISSPTGAELDLVIDDHDNPPLDVHGIRAIIARMPYIFFESANGAELTATYGAERRAPVAAPRYDLEALRDTVKTIAAATATWGVARETRTVAAVAAPSALYAAPGAPLDASSFAFSRPMPIGSGLTAVRLDAAVLAHSRLDDVRILDAQGRQVPYLLEILEEPTALALPALEPIAARATVNSRVVADAAKRTWYRLRLPHAGLPDASLRLSTSARVFARDVGVIMHELRRDAASDAGIDRSASGLWTATPRGSRSPARRCCCRHTGCDSSGSRERDEVVAKPERAGTSTFGRVPLFVFWGMLGVVVVVLLLLIARLVRNGPSVAADEG